jgi:signal transduction histidine kinase
MNEMKLLAKTGIDPETGQPFDSGDRLLATFLGRRLSEDSTVMFGVIDSVVSYRSVGEATIRPDKDFDFLELIASLKEPRVGTFTTVEGDMRYGVLPITGVKGEEGTLVIATLISSELEATNRLFEILAIGLLILFALTGLILSYIIRKSLLPITELTRAAESVNRENINQGLNVGQFDGNDEVTQLGIEFNNMLARLETSFAEQQRFIDDAGHELRTPLTILKGHLELMRRDGSNSQSLKIMEDEVDRMARLVQDLQSLTKASQPNFVQMSTFAADVFMKEIWEKAQVATSNPIELVEYPSSEMHGDKQRLTQAMLQLIENAVKYSPRSSPISIGMYLHESSLVMYVKDLGAGISDEAKPNVFSRFYQVDNTSSPNDVGGIGLGLAIVRAIVDAHHGSIEVSDNHPTGSIFSIRIPKIVSKR